MSETISILLNGQPAQLPAGLSLRAALEHLGLGTERLAVERNLEVIPRSQWDQIDVLAGDRLEVIHFVGGGC